MYTHKKTEILTMDALFLVYNLCLMTFYSLPLALAVFVYFKGKRDALHLYIAVLFLSYILNNIVIYMTESISWFSTFYDSTFMSVPTVRTLIFISTFYCMVKINERALRLENRYMQIAALLLLFVFLLFVPMLPNSAFKVWLYYGSCQLFTFLLGIYSLFRVKRAPEGYYPEYVARNYRRILLWTILFSVIIEIEDTIVIFNFDVYTDTVVKIINRSFSEDVESLYFAVVALLYLINLIQVKVSDSAEETAQTENIPVIPENVAAAIPADSGNSTDTYSKFYLFCRKYQLTTREQDIMRKLLENKNNTDISEELFISIGTAKTHIHNIFSKLEVKKRSQLIDKYNAFQDKELESEGGFYE